MTEYQPGQLGSILFSGATGTGNATGTLPQLDNLFATSVPSRPVETATPSDTKSNSIKTDAEPTKSSRVHKNKNDPSVQARTMFVGNVNVEVLKNKKCQKEFLRLFTPFGKIDNYRFRSVAVDSKKPRKFAIANGELHEERSVCNSYIVFIEPESVAAALSLNGTMFMEKHLRLDTLSQEKNYDTRRSVFVANIPFTIEEEKLWHHFETCGTVTNVRVVRDAKTGLGKGFGYVEFEDTAGKGLALRLHDSELEGRAIRVTPCMDSTKYSQQRQKERFDLMKQHATKKLVRKLKDKAETHKSAARQLAKVTNRLGQNYEGQRATKSQNPLRKTSKRSKYIAKKGKSGKPSRKRD
ncbi:Nucleolar protein 12 [Dispira parvispora]|uniref:Nucleolar protein 12 n=1 Tax=Dispira parvispora TaxID=1520584 RepID=A0A9W8ALN6_9FUNG|nr:Nucleolar protein 12 [Dispira parvispora]